MPGRGFADLGGEPGALGHAGTRIDLAGPLPPDLMRVLEGRHTEFVLDRHTKSRLPDLDIEGSDAMAIAL